MKQLPLIGILLCLTIFCKANIVINESNYNKEIDLSENLFCYEDPTCELTFETATSEQFFKNYTQLRGNHITLGKSNCDIWVLFKLQNTTQQTHNYFLTIKNPMIEELVFFSSVDSSFFNTGLRYPFKQRQDESKNYNFVIGSRPMQTTTYCIKLSAQKQVVTVPISITPGKKYFGDGSTTQALNGLVYALALLTILLLLMLYISEKEKAYISGLILMSCITLFLLWCDLTIYKFIIPDSPASNMKLGNILLPLTLTAFAYHIRNSMTPPQPTDKNRISASTAVLIAGFAVMLLSAITFGYYVHKTLQIFYMAMVIAYFTYCAIKTTEKKTSLYKLNLAVYATILISLIYKSFITKEYGMSVYTDEHYVKIALLAFSALSFYVFSKKFITSRSEYIELSHNMEKGISKRTELINQQKEELSSQREELIQQKDALQDQREELRAQKELLQLKNDELSKISQVTNLSNNMIAIFKPNGELDWFNDAFGKSFNIELDEYKTSEPINVIDISNNKNLKTVLASCLREKEVISYESEITSNIGNVRCMQTTLTPILDDQEEVKLIISVDTDITQLKLYETKIEQQKAEAEKQRNIALKQKDTLEMKQNELFGSIRYAKRIQTSMMPKPKQILRDFSDSFILFLPKDIVSGDFYWYHRIDDKYFIAAVDCTGHGVPGAFLSIIGSHLLNSIVIHNGIHHPAEILKHLNRKIKISLKSTEFSDQNNDGMDIAIAVIDKNAHSLEFAGALRPMYLYSGNEFVELKGDKIPITSNISGTTAPNNNYTNYEHKFNPGDQFYIFSDGIIDQFGGDDGKKFLTKRFKNLLENIKTRPMKEQKELIKKSLEDWRGSKYDQIDDILVIGIRYVAEDL